MRVPGWKILTKEDTEGHWSTVTFTTRDTEGHKELRQASIFLE